MQNSEDWYVSKVSDGDTITARQEDGSELKVRLCGVDAPEKSQPLGKESTEYLRSLLAKTNNQILLTPIEKDRYGRTIAEIFIQLPNGSEQFIQEELLKAGLAYHYKQYSGNCPNQNVFDSAEEIARNNHAGVWNGSHQKPWDYRRLKRANN